MNHKEDCQVELSTDQYVKLATYLGCGPLSTAKILFMGNEEGTGGYPDDVEANLAARFRLYGKSDTEVNHLLSLLAENPSELLNDKKFPAENYQHCFAGSWENGFWEPNALGGKDKIERYIETINPNLSRKDASGSTFLKHIARLCLAVQKFSPSEPVRDWLYTAPEHPDKYAAVKEFSLTQLFNENVLSKDTLLTGLMDWWPLPRPNQKVWPSEYHKLGKNDKDYLKTFLFNSKNKDNSFVHDLAIKRAELFKRLIINSSAECLITVGKVDAKMSVLKYMYNDLKFNKIDLGRKGIRGYAGEWLQSNNKRMKIYCLPFFDSTSMPLESLYFFAANYLIPSVHGDSSDPVIEASSKPINPTKKKEPLKHINTDNLESLKVKQQKVKKVTVDAPATKFQSILEPLLEMAKEAIELAGGTANHSQTVGKNKTHNYIHLWYQDNPCTVMISAVISMSRSIKIQKAGIFGLVCTLMKHGDMASP